MRNLRFAAAGIAILLASVVLAESAFDLSVQLFREIAGSRDADGTLRQAERQLRDGVNAINTVAGEVSQADGDLEAVAKSVQVALKAISLAESTLASSKWTVSNEAFPWAVILPLLPSHMAETPDLQEVNQWMNAQLGTLHAALSDWVAGKSSVDMIFTVQTDASRIHQILARAVGANEIPPLPPAD
jgi:hypothetical protein